MNAESLWDGCAVGESDRGAALGAEPSLAYGVSIHYPILQPYIDL